MEPCRPSGLVIHAPPLPKTLRLDEAMLRGLVRALLGPLDDDLSQFHCGCEDCLPTILQRIDEEGRAILNIIGDSIVTCGMNSARLTHEGTMEALYFLDKVLQDNFMVKCEPRVGPGRAGSGKYLNRTIKWTDIGFTWEPDSRHVATTIEEELGLSGAKAAPTPRSTSTGASNDALDELDANEANMFRRVAGVSLYLAAVCKDIQVAVRNDADCKDSDMSKPTLGMARVKRLGRYLIYAPNVVSFAYQSRPACVQVLVETNWAGDKITRRSVSAGDLYHGKHLLESYSSTHQVIALSSGEAQIYAIGKGAAAGLLLKHIMEELHGNIHLEVYNAGRPMCQRIGCAKERHLHTHRQRRKEFTFKAVRTDDNTEDLGTKNLDGARIERLMYLSGYRKGPNLGWQGRGVAALAFLPRALGAQMEQSSSGGFYGGLVCGVFLTLLLYLLWFVGQSYVYTGIDWVYAWFKNKVLDFIRGDEELLRMLRDDEDVQDEARRAAERAWFADEIRATELARELDRAERAAEAERREADAQRDEAYQAAAGRRERVEARDHGHAELRGHEEQEPPNMEQDDHPFHCPACGAEQRLRYQRGGSNEPFWGCSTFPSCRATSRWSGPDMQSEVRRRRQMNEAQRLLRGD